MTKEEYLVLGAKFALHQMYERVTIETASADGCNLWVILQAGLGEYEGDVNGQPKLDDIVALVKKQLGE